MRVVAIGAGGGDGGTNNPPVPQPLGQGAPGARVTAYLTGLSASTPLWVEVGGRGSTGSNVRPFPQQPVDTPGGGGGFNGGAGGGASQSVPPPPGGSSGGFASIGGGGGGGGGASDVRTVSCAGACPGDAGAQASRLLTAGGGGGGGGQGGSAAASGGAGSRTGNDGGSSNLSAGGTGGGAADARGGNGGGNFGGGSGGGGGGYKGGTGGAGSSGIARGGAGGGGGSSFASFAPSASFSTASAATDGSVEITPVSQTSLATTASPAVTVGGQISDSAVLSGGSSPTGTVTFLAYGADDATCGNPPAFSSSATVNGNNTYGSGSFTPTQPGTYRFVATYGGDAANSPATGACGDAGERVVVSRVEPTLTTQASGPVTVGDFIEDDATLSGGVNPTGSITFKAYGPDDSTCTDTVQLAVTKTVTGNGTYNSGAFPPNDAGTYRFVASYSGDSRNAPVTGSCLDPSESVVVSEAQPSLSTTASAEIALGGQISDAATLSGGHSPTGTMTFDVYGPADATCSGTPVFSSSKTVDGSGDYGSGSFTPAAPGTYRFVASYSGDRNNTGTSGTCGDAGESVVVAKAQPGLATSASPDTSAGSEISDQATLSGGHSPGGTITFKAYGPDDTTCSDTPVFTSTVQVDSGNATYGSGSFTATHTGTYRFVASYSGDGNNSAASGSCGDAGESVVVAKAQSSLSTTASPATAAGGGISDHVTVSGGVDPTGTIDFKVYGPDDATCAGAPGFTRAVAVSGNGTYDSGPFVAMQAGSYRFVASYSGDADNAGAAGSCNDTGESVVVAKAQPTLMTTASGSGGPGGQISDEASLSGAANPTGTITYDAYGPDDPTCAGAPAFSETKAVDGNGIYDSGQFTPQRAGTYSFVASYSGDANNSPASGSCIDPAESVVVAQAQPTLTTTASGSGPTGNEISDRATLSGGYNPTGTIEVVVYGPGDASCSQPLLAWDVDVDGNGDYEAGPYTAGSVGTYRFVASYGGDENNAAASGSCGDPGESATMTTRSTQTSISCNAGAVGDEQACAVSVKDSESGTASKPTGTVTLSAPDGRGSFTTASCQLESAGGASDSSSCETAAHYVATAAGINEVHAAYEGDSTHTSSSGDGEVEVRRHSTETHVDCPATTVGDAVSCDVTVADTNNGSKTNPSGTVDLSSPGGNGSFAAASCTLQPVTGSPHTSHCDPAPSYTPSTAGGNEVRADYGGDATHATSGATTSVDSEPHSTETTLSCANGTVGDPESCTVSVKDVNGGSKTNPSGTVDLSAPDGNGAFGPSSCDLKPAGGSTDTSRCDTDPAYTAATAGANEVQADYGGDATHAASGSGAQDVHAAKHSSTASVACSPASVTSGGATTCTATVADGRGGSSPPRPGGTVTFTTGDSGSFGSSGSCTLPANGANSCQATYTAAAAGSHAITAAYGGDVNHTASSAQTSVAATAPASGGGGSAPAAQAPQPDGLSISHRNPLIRHGKVLITIRCRGPRGSTCKGLLVLTASRLTSRLRAAAQRKTSVRFTIAAGHRKVLRVRVPNASLARLRHLRKAVAIASVALKLPDGTTKAQKRAITIVRR